MKTAIFTILFLISFISLNLYSQSSIKHYAIDGKSFDSRYDRNAYEDDMADTIHFDLFELYIEDHITESLSDSLEMALDEYRDMIKKTRERNYMVEIPGNKRLLPEHKENLRKRNVKWGKFKTHNKDTFYIEDYKNMFNRLIKSYVTAFEAIKKEKNNPSPHSHRKLADLYNKLYTEYFEIIIPMEEKIKEKGLGLY